MTHELLVICFPFRFVFIFALIVFSLPYLSLAFNFLENKLACDEGFFAMRRGNSDDCDDKNMSRTRLMLVKVSNQLRVPRPAQHLIDGELNGKCKPEDMVEELINYVHELAALLREQDECVLRTMSDIVLMANFE